MKYINTFKNHSSYEEKLNGGGVDISLPNVSYCEDVKDVHYTPYNLVRFYVGEITGTTHQTVSIYTDGTSVDVQVSEGNKWYTYVLPKDKGLYRISNSVVKKVVVKADISYNGGNHMYPPERIIPKTTIEASFKGSNTSNITSMYGMFDACSNLTSLDVSSFDTSNVTDMKDMFDYCSGLASLDVSSFDTSKVTDMSYMFYNCSGLASLDVSSFDTSKVTLMNGMFQDCSKLTSLNLSKWDVSNVNNMSSMFEGCTSLRKIRMVGCTTETRTKIEEALTAARIKDNVTIVTE